MITQVKAQADF